MKKLLLCCLLLLFALSCSNPALKSNAAARAWHYSDLRALDPSDSSSPYYDMLAFYSRQEGNVIQFRIDFLDQKIENYPSVMLLFNNGWGGNTNLPIDIIPKQTWNDLLWIPPDGHVVLQDQSGNQAASPKVSIIRDLDLDAIVINIDESSIYGISEKTEVELFAFDNASADMDHLGPIRLSTPPPARGKVMLAFWDTFKADTPAQALRSWDGAHTGPFSSRHGLVSLVEAIENTGIPVFLFDIERPKTESIFDYLGVAERFRSLIDQGKIIPVDPRSTLSPELSQLNDDAAGSFVNNLSEDIPSIPVRRALIAAAENPNSPLFLGGDFRQTAWGISSTANQMLSYIKNHPWLEPVRDLSLIQNPGKMAAADKDPLVEKIGTELRSSPKNKITTLSEQLLSSLTEPGTQRESKLKRVYLGQMGHLLALAKWGANRQAISDCSQDLDWDSEPECILASQDLAAVIDLQGGYISYAFAFHAGEFHQIIGPSYQLAVGLSDPMTWQLDQSVSADPSVIPGAFSCVNDKWGKYQVAGLEPASITLQAEKRDLEKEFRLTEDGIYFRYKGDPDEILAIPLILDPWTMEEQNWGERYSSELTPQHWFWGLDNRITVETIFEDSLSVATFKDSFTYIQTPEDPSFAYPAGHYLPFPLALGQLATDGEGTVMIKLSY